MHLNAAAEQSPSRASLGLLGVSLRHRNVAVVWLGAIRRRSLPRISLRFGTADRRRWRRNDRLAGYGHDFLLANRENSPALPFIQEWCRDERCFSRAANRSPPAVSGHGPLFDKEEQGTNVKKACALAEKTDKAIRGSCKRYGIGGSMPGSPIEISVPAWDGETWRRSSAGSRSGRGNRGHPWLSGISMMSTFRNNLGGPTSSRTCRRPSWIQHAV
ncbi:hypothetical protein DLJ82_6739 (plasmid) [Rhizobium leguminosarum]|uniref:Uncharacterized protein n=1 Tax=Rhizobium leguminosarum TaxID=384 RepID=A0A2Z4YUD0_RHILE|nr:hypothetical protein DLJ82_6739 [Rhizobium leguminosarum]